MEIAQATATNADLLYGIAAISAALGLTPRQAKHRIAQGEVPTFKMGRTLCASRTGLAAWLTEREAAGRAAAAK